MISLVLKTKDIKIFKKEAFLISKIVKKGYSAHQIYCAYNYWQNVEKKTLTSFAFFLWHDCELLKKALEHTLVLPSDKKVVELEDKDYRQLELFPEKPKTLLEKLS